MTAVGIPTTLFAKRLLSVYAQAQSIRLNRQAHSIVESTAKMLEREAHRNKPDPERTKAAAEVLASISDLTVQKK